jgi:hypothetical protein
VSRVHGGGGKRIAADKLADVFGIELEDGPSVAPRPARKTQRPAAQARKLR